MVNRGIRTMIALTLAVIVQAAGNVCLSLGMRSVAELARSDSGGWLAVASAGATIPWLWVGAGLLLTFFLLFTAVLSWSELSLAVPIVSFEIIVNVALARILLGEEVSALRWAGAGLVAIGVAMVAGSGSWLGIPADQGRERS